MKTIAEYVSTAEGTGQMWDGINEILDEFDFSAVHVAMEALEWYWAVPGGEYEELLSKGRRVVGPKENATYLPEVGDLIKQARSLLTEVIKDAADDEKDEWFISTGGFEVSVRVMGDEERIRVFGDDAPDDFKHAVELRLKFVLEENMSKSW